MTTPEETSEQRAQRLARKVDALFKKMDSLRSMGTPEAENEALAIFEKAQQIITENSIDEELRRMADKGNTTKKVSLPVVKYYYLDEGPYLKSRALLAFRIAQAMGLPNRVANDGSYVIYVGFPEDTEAAWQMFKAVEPQMMANAKRRIRNKEHHDIWDYSTASRHVSAKTFTFQYCEGYSTEVWRRLNLVRQESAKAIVIAEGVGEEQVGRVTGELVLKSRELEVKRVYDERFGEAKHGTWRGPRSSRGADPADLSSVRRAGSRDGAEARLRAASELTR